jgi:arabinan endo-1,5-alpha-L-arabinosidase
MSLMLLLFCCGTLAIYGFQSFASDPNLQTGAVIDRDFPDPGVIGIGSMFYAYATNSGGINIQLARSMDLANWERLPDAMPQLPAWARAGYTWAPEVCQLPGSSDYRLYFVARDRASGLQCIGVAAATGPSGPFHSPRSLEKRPLVAQVDAGGSIDPCVFVEDDGTAYLLWKNDGNAVGLKTWIFIQKLAPDGLSLVGSPKPLLCADLSWEGNLIEAPTLLKQDGKYVLFYSANSYACERYAIGYAVSDSLFGPYQKSTTPLLKSDGVHCGPGGQTLIRSNDGRTWLLYHSWDASGRYRAMHVARIEWTHGRPVVVPARLDELPHPERNARREAVRVAPASPALISK